MKHILYTCDTCPRMAPGVNQWWGAAVVENDGVPGFNFSPLNKHNCEKFELHFCSPECMKTFMEAQASAVDLNKVRIAKPKPRVSMLDGFFKSFEIDLHDSTNTNKKKPENETDASDPGEWGK